jgi:hypothetical protein
MSAPLTAPAPVGGPSARSDGHLPPTVSRPAPSARTETARAPQPVDGASGGLDIRLEDAQGRPVGPPPAFQTSLLAAMHEAALKPRSAPPGEAPALPPVPEQMDLKI